MSQISNWKNNVRYNPESPQAEPYVVQRYINDPLIIGGKKFDMRIYALVTCYQPLTVYLYRTGFARFTHHRYDNEDISNAFVHLTNVAIQKNSENYDSTKGGKWNLNQLKLYLLSKFGQEKVSECYAQIQNIIIKSLLAVQKKIINDKHCFELYGYDILLDSSLRPWLLEVNASPSMTANTATDSELKINLIDDTLTIIDLEKILSGNEEQIGGFDLICKGNPVKQPANRSKNNRIQNIKKLAKSTAVRLAQQYLEKEANNPTNIPAVNAPLSNDFISKNKKIAANTKPRNSKASNNSHIKNLPKAKNIKDNQVSTNFTIQQSTAFTQNVITNITNMSKKGSNSIPKKHFEKKIIAKNKEDEEEESKRDEE